MKNRFRKQNFSLLEMMVVVAIILILCMMLMPAINSAKEVARRSQCLSRVREVAQLQSRFAANNNGQLPLAQYFTPPGETTASKADFSVQIMQSLIPEAAKGRDEHWWMFACTNVLPYWNAGSSMNGGAGYEKGKVNDYLEPLWVRIKPENQGKKGDVGYLSGHDKHGAIEVTGNFGVNDLGDFPSRSILDEDGNSRTAIFAHMSQVKSPGKRAFIAEEGESVNKDNASHLIEVVEFNKPISRGLKSPNHGTATGYLPGMGAGGIGREKMERIGFDSTILDELDEERLELVKKDVMEGRHAGATLHGFFDGHAEVVDAATVGHLQLRPGEEKKDRRGYYGKITEAADEDEE